MIKARVGWITKVIILLLPSGSPLTNNIYIYNKHSESIYNPCDYPFVKIKPTYIPKITCQKDPMLWFSYPIRWHSVINPKLTLWENDGMSAKFWSLSMGAPNSTGLGRLGDATGYPRYPRYARGRRTGAAQRGGFKRCFGSTAGCDRGEFFVAFSFMKL